MKKNKRKNKIKVGKYNFQSLLKERNKQKMENKDRIIKMLAYNGRINIICANTTSLVEKARKMHDLSPVAVAAFGRTLTITALMAVNMKNETDKLTVQIKGNGPLGGMVIVSNNFPKLKGLYSA